MRTVFDQDPDGMAPDDAPEAIIIPAGFGASPDPANAILDASPQVELFDEALWCVPKQRFRPRVVADPTVDHDADGLAQAVMAALGGGGLPVVLAADLGPSLTSLVRGLSGASSIDQVMHFSAFPTWHSALAPAQDTGVHDIVSWGLREVSASDVGACRPPAPGYAPYWYGDSNAGNPARCRGRYVLAVDLSVFDSALMPAVARPVPGGPDWNEVMAMMGHVTASAPPAGMILSGLRPNPSLHAADFLAAKLLYKMITMALCRQTP